MTRAIAALVAAAVATALIFGPGRALLGGSSVRAELSGGGVAQTTDEHSGHEQATSAAPAVAPTAAKPGPNGARVAFTAAPATKLEKGYALSVRLTGPDARPVNETDVSFYEIVDLFGQREMYIGQAATDGQGNAALLYLPAQLGPRQIVARSSAHGQVTWGESRLTLDPQVAAASYRVEPPLLAAFSAVLPYWVGVVVLSVWALLAFALLSTARGVLGGARDHAQRKGDLA
jgi:hypothetical protein